MKRLHKRFLLATFCALFTATLQAADVTITVNGRVVAKPCTIQTKEANVNLGDLYTRNLQQPLYIHVGDNPFVYTVHHRYYKS